MIFFFCTSTWLKGWLSSKRRSLQQNGSNTDSSFCCNDHIAARYASSVIGSGANTPTLVTFVALDECPYLLSVPNVESNSLGDVLVTRAFPRASSHSSSRLYSLKTDLLSP